MNMERGFRCKLDDHVNTSQPIQVRIQTEGSAEYDTCCFGVDENEKLSDDRYMVFYNQPVSPGGEIHYAAQGNSADYQVNLASLPGSIAKLVFTVSIDGAGTMGQIRSHSICIMQNGRQILELSLSGRDFQNEKAIIGIEMYRKGVWRLSVVARGFNGGLGDLLKSFGGEIAGESQPSNPAPVSAPAMQRPAQTMQRPAPVPVNPEQQLTNRLMGRINLSKDKVKLEKHVVKLSKCVV